VVGEIHTRCLQDEQRSGDMAREVPAQDRHMECVANAIALPAEHGDGGCGGPGPPRSALAASP
jgi:hypothetical protein